MTLSGLNLNEPKSTIASQSEPRAKSIFSQLAEWMLLPNGYIDTIRRLTGIYGILVFAYDIFLIHLRGGLQPFLVPTWRFGEHLLFLPMPPHWLTLMLLATYVVSCLAMGLGFGSKVFLLAPISVPLYYGCMDTTVADFGVPMLCIALFFHAPNRSMVRRIIQLQLAVCYGYSVLQKVTMPGFMNGDSLEAFAHDPFAVNAFCLRAVSKFNPPHEMFAVIAWAVVLVELFLCFALFPRRTRRLATSVGILFHSILTSTMIWGVGLFVALLLPLYLSFFDGRKIDPPDVNRSTADQSKPRKIATIAALAFVVFFLTIPLRLYFWPQHPVSQLSASDRRPWSYSMFVVDSQPIPNRMHAHYTDVNGVFHPITPFGRMQYSVSDNALYAMAQYIQSNHPDAAKITIEAYVSMNGKWCQKKTLQSENGKTTIDWQVSKN